LKSLNLPAMLSLCLQYFLIAGKYSLKLLKHFSSILNILINSLNSFCMPKSIASRHCQTPAP